MLTYITIKSIILVKSIIDKKVGFALVYPRKTFLINSTPELKQFCCVSDSRVIHSEPVTRRGSQEVTNSDLASSSSSITSTTSTTSTIPAQSNQCITINSPFSLNTDHKELIIGKYLNRYFLFAPKPKILFAFEHNAQEIIKIIKTLKATTIVLNDGSILNPTELLVYTVLS